MQDLIRTANAVIPGRLYMGGFMTMDWPGWDYVVAAAVEAPPPEHLGDQHSVHMLLDDEEFNWRQDVPWIRAVLGIARRVATRVSNGQRVLVACHHGWNRSGLITAFALRYLGATPAQAMAQVRKARGPEALNNRSFEEAVRMLPL